MAVWLPHFKIFLDLAETKSFTLAAKRNNISQVAVSIGLQRIENEFNAKFVDRHTRSFQLTKEGELFLDCARQIVQASTNLTHRLENLPPEVPDPALSTIRISAIPYIGLNVLPPYLIQFQKEQPHLNIVVKYAQVDQIYEDLLKGNADVGLLASPIKRRRFTMIPLSNEPLVLICSPQHQFAKQKKVKLKDFRGETFLSFEQGGLGYEFVEYFLKDRGLRKKYVRQFNEIEPIKRAVEIGIGVAIVPKVTVQREVADRTLVSLRMENGKLNQSLAAICLTIKARLPLVKTVTTFLKAAFNKSD